MSFLKKMSLFSSWLFLVQSLFHISGNAHGLAAGTLIHTPNGQVPIESLQVGDEIMSCDENMCRPGIVTQKSLQLVSEHIEADINGEIFYLSETHPIWDEKTDSWVEAAVYATRYIKEVTWLYNIAVDEHHNYHIGSNTLVHNYSAEIEVEFNALSDREQAMFLILMEAEKIGLHNPAQLSYILATAEHETMNFKKMKEIGGEKARYDPYYGRGYVQLTHKYNYEKFGKLLNINLVDKPDLAMDKKTSAFIIVYGMLHGAFTGAKLVTYIEGFGNGKGKADFINARRVVNGVDRAEHIAMLAKQWMQYFRKHRYAKDAASLSWLKWSAYHDEL